ncbi:MAG: polysaccharide deacetylase family protein [Actinomycetota bacterium]
MDRRSFLKGAGLSAGVLVGGGATIAAVLPQQSVAHDELDTRSYANERYGDDRLSETRIVWKGPTTQKLIALTFDDGPMPKYTPAILDILAEKKVRATFMVVGSRVEANPDLFRREMAGKHEIGNHTWSHAILPFVDRNHVDREMRRTDELIEKLTGRRPTLFRPPRGCISGDVLTVASRLEYDVLMWSLQFHEDAFDAAGNVSYIADKLVPGTVLLAHDYGNASRQVDLDALPALIDAVRARGYEFVTASELLSA